MSGLLSGRSNHSKDASSTSTASTSSSSAPISVEGGQLTIKLVDIRGLVLPDGIELAAEAASRAVRPASVGGSGTRHRKRESIMRAECSHVPYTIITFENNEVIIDPLGGSFSSPSYMFTASFDVSRASDVIVATYLRHSSVKQLASPGHRRSESSAPTDVFLGGTTFLPNFDPRRMSDGWYKADHGAGEFRIQLGFKPSQHQPLTINDFELLKVIGKGSFGKVMQVRKHDTGRIYALKTIKKSHIISRGEMTHTLAERTILARVTSPYIVALKMSFQSPEKLYLVLAYVNGGELFRHLQEEGCFSESRCRLYSAEMLSALDHLHGFDVVYRDLKPENVLLDWSGHILLVDFGLCKLQMAPDDKTSTFAGTPEYLAPELILGEGYTRTVDWWTLGILLYEMLTGLPPFYETSEHHQEMYRRIVHEPLPAPAAHVGRSAIDICTSLLQKDPAQRLGASGAEEIRRHLFFAKIDWDKLERREIEPEWRPSVANAIDTSNVDDSFLSEPALDSVDEQSHILSDSMQQAFRGFTYEAPSGLESVR